MIHLLSIDRINGRRVNKEVQEDKFKNSPIHDKRAILEIMDKLDPKAMVKVVDFIQGQVKLLV